MSVAMPEQDEPAEQSQRMTPDEGEAAAVLAAARAHFDGRLQKEEDTWCTLDTATVYVSCRRTQNDVRRARVADQAT